MIDDPCMFIMYFISCICFLVRFFKSSNHKLGNPFHYSDPSSSCLFPNLGTDNEYCADCT